MAQNTGLFRDRSDHKESLLQLFELIKANNEEVEAKRTVYKLIFSLHLTRFVCLFFFWGGGGKNCLFFLQIYFRCVGYSFAITNNVKVKNLVPYPPPRLSPLRTFKQQPLTSLPEVVIVYEMVKRSHCTREIKYFLIATFVMGYFL